MGGALLGFVFNQIESVRYHSAACNKHFPTAPILLHSDNAFGSGIVANAGLFTVNFPIPVGCLLTFSQTAYANGHFWTLSIFQQIHLRCQIEDYRMNFSTRLSCSKMEEAFGSAITMTKVSQNGRYFLHSYEYICT